LVQRVFPLNQTMSLKITTAKYFTPSGRLIQKTDYFEGDTTIIVGAPAPKEVPAADGIYKTDHGRPVLGGGGISPDVEVDAEFSDHWGDELLRAGAFFNFANEYCGRHPELKETTGTVEISESIFNEFQEWVKNSDLEISSEGQPELDELTNLMKSRPDSSNPEIQTALQLLQKTISDWQKEGFDRDREYIRKQLAREIQGNLQGTKGRIEASFSWDPQIVRAIEILRDNNYYTQILSGDKLATVPDKSNVNR
jgi:carboxyl-terminal processing protease